MNQPIQTLLIHSAAAMQNSFRRVALDHSDVATAKVLSTAVNVAAEIRSESYHAVIIEAGLPRTDVVQLTQQIRAADSQVPIILLSTQSVADGRVCLKAVSAGATSSVVVPGNLDDQKRADWITNQLLPVLRKEYQTARFRRPRNLKTPPPADLLAAVAKAKAASRKTPVRPPSQTAIPATVNGGIVVIASSTGGVIALKNVLSTMAPSIQKPVVIVQHMLASFSGFTVDQLNRCSQMPVLVAEEDQTLLAGHVYFAPGGKHTELKAESGGTVAIQLTDGPAVNSCKPAADVLFRAAAKVFGKRVQAAVLTGMGQDGMVGCQSVKAAGGSVIVQDEASCVVWGMPKAVYEAGLADKVVELNDIGAYLTQTPVKVR